MAAPQDTRTDAWKRQVDGFRSMEPRERLRVALAMTDEVNDIARAGIRARHPEWTPAEIQENLEELLLGAELTRTARRARVRILTPR